MNSEHSCEHEYSGCKKIELANKPSAKMKNWREIRKRKNYLNMSIDVHTFLNPLHIRAYGFHNAHEFMTHDVATLHSRHSAHIHVEVRATNASRRYTQNHILLRSHIQVS